MADTSSATNGLDQSANAPQIGINTQYLKDLSFENPGAPQTLATNPSGMEIGIKMDCQVKPLTDNVHEVVLTINAEAKANGHTVYIVEVSYGGVFTLANIPAEHQRPVLLIEGPRHLFPFARAVLSNAVRDGGFPPLFLNPIDFTQMFRRSAAEQSGEPIHTA